MSNESGPSDRKIFDQVTVDEDAGRLTVRFHRDLYRPEAVFQAACSFFDRVMVLVDLVGDDLVVAFEKHGDVGDPMRELAREFLQMVYSYSAYMYREERTRDVREGLLDTIRDES
jgi:hypothetical protein